MSCNQTAHMSCNHTAHMSCNNTTHAGTRTGRSRTQHATIRAKSRCMHPAASSRSDKEKQQWGPLHTPKPYHAQRSRRAGNAAQKRQVPVSDALHTDNTICTGKLTDVHLSPTDISLTNTHQHLPVYHTMRVDVMSREDVTTQKGGVDRWLGQVPDQRGCSTWHQGANGRQSVWRGGEQGGRTATGAYGVAPRATETTDHDRGGGRRGAGAGKYWESGSSAPGMSRSPPVSCVAGAPP